jgi:hypothetical protein
MITEITFELESDTSVKIMRKNKQIGQLWSEKRGEITPFPHNRANKTLNSIQLCGFDGQSEIWSCSPFEGHKDSCFYFDCNPIDESLKRYKEYIDGCIRNGNTALIKSYHDWRLHN